MRETTEYGLSFGELEGCLAIMMRVADHKRSTFISRLKQWQKMGFPAVGKVGRGSRVQYKLEHFFQLVVMMQLLRLGLTPERAIGYVNHAWPVIRRGVLETIDHLAGGYDVITYVILNQNALAELEGRDHIEATRSSADIIRDAEFAGLWLGIDDEDEDAQSDEASQISPSPARRGYSSAAWKELHRMKLAASVVLELTLLVIGVMLALSSVTEADLSAFSPEIAAWRISDHEWHDREGQWADDRDFHTMERDTKHGTWRDKLLPPARKLASTLLGRDQPNGNNPEA